MPSSCSTVGRSVGGLTHTSIGTVMLASTIVAMSELTLLAIEANRVIALRMRVLMLGGVAAMTEAELMVREKQIAVQKAISDLSGGASQAAVRSDIRSVVQGNIVRLSSRRS